MKNQKKDSNLILNYILNNTINVGCICNLLNKDIINYGLQNINNFSILFSFIDNLDDMISFFNLSFPALIHKEKYFSMVIENNFPKKFLSKRFNKLSIDKKKYYYKVIITKNLRDNLKYIESNLNTFMSQINYKKNNSKNLNEVEYYYILLKEIVWCNYNYSSLIYLFTNYKILEIAEENIYEKLCDNLTLVLTNYQQKIYYIKKLKILNDVYL